MKKLTLVLITLGLGFNLMAQEGTALWSGIQIDKKVHKKFEINFNAQVRLADNFSYARTFLAELGAGYKLNKNWEIAAYYRFINRRKNEYKDFKIRHRYYADLAYKKKWGAIKFNYRVRYQYQFKDNDNEYTFDSSYLRNKFEISYPNKSKFSPYISADFFYEISKTFDQVRPKIGVNWEINKKNNLEASLFTNLDFQGIDKAIPIIGLNYHLKL